MYIYNKEKLPIPVFKGHDDWVELYYKAWELLFNNVEYIQKEGWKPQLTCMPGVGTIWQWDSCIMTFITNYSNATISAFGNLDNLYRLRREEDGFMAMAYKVETETPAYGERINPPLMAWSEWEYYLISGDLSRFEKVLPALEGCYSYIENNRRRKNGLYWFEDSGSSGMDNSPRGGYPSTHLDGCDVCYIDLACQQALSAKCISNIYRVLGDKIKEEFYLNENKRICELINKYHWSEKSGWYFDFFIRDDNDKKVKFINSKTAASFWTIISGCATGERLKRVVKHMFNEDEFYTPVPFASLSKDDPNYDENGGYWLGGVWAPTNYAAIRGLKENAYPELAREAAIKYLDAICKVNNDKAWGSFWEAYAPQSFKPSTTEDGIDVRDNFIGWSGIAPITIFIENIIGLEFNAPNNTVTFTPFSDNICGLKNMQFGDNVVSVEYEKYDTSKDKIVILVEAEKPFTLIVKMKLFHKESKIEVPAGKYRFQI